MADKIKKFFQKKKIDAKFKLAGPGHKLNESGNASGSSSSSNQNSVNRAAGYVPPQRTEPSSANRQAAEAALARLNSQKKDGASFNTSLAAIQAQVKRELEAERKERGQQQDVAGAMPSRPLETSLEASPLLACTGVYFRCPMISDEVLPKGEWRVKIKNFLYEQLEEERGLTACLIIHSCNYNRIKVTECVEILCKYLENILANPTEAKYQKIRCANAAFRDKVEPILGAPEFLFAAGFRTQELESNGASETFWVFSTDNVENLSVLEFLRDAIKAEDRIELVLDRNVQVLSPAQANKRVELPDAFFAISKDEIKKEQQLRTEALEKQMQLRTKAMREKDEIREIRRYKFALMRIRFPDGIFLQGTFSVYEKFSEVIDFLRVNLEHDFPFVLSSPTGHKFEESDNEKTLADLRLVPATILHFQWEPSMAEDILKVSTGYLKPEVTMLIQPL